MWSSPTSSRFVPERLSRGQAAQLASEALATLLGLTWIGFFLLQQVHIPVLSPSQEVEALLTQSLTGVQGQTFVAPIGGLSRIDLELDTRIPPDEWVRVKFELARGVKPRTTLASAIAVFDRSREGWPVRLTFDPDLTSAGDRLYLRLESILSSPRAEVYYRYSRQDIDPHGALLDLDQLHPNDRDLLLTLFRAPHVPKPLAWIEAFTARADQAAHLAGLVPAWLVPLVGTLALAAALVAFTAGVHLLVRVSEWRSTLLTAPAIAALLCAAALLLLAWNEIPIGKLMLDLA